MTRTRSVPGRTTPHGHGPATDGTAEQTLLVLGASGDLTARLLLSGLAGLLASGRGEGLSLIGSGMDDWDEHRWRTRVADSFAAAHASGPQVDAVVKGTRSIFPAPVVDARTAVRWLRAHVDRATATAEWAPAQ